MQLNYEQTMTFADGYKKGFQEGERSEREFIQKKLVEYFKGLVAMPDPQSSLQSILAALDLN